eukprot:comp13982_c0_seq1/m.19809 comp13982_c0_seq1/g.19809  ORF comp13982_c0_seq1/g.19809 comp13982_c0_seq1/m.19809 type:complete len:308 (+) comp13982_c0_seq1:69-992(+)
MDYFDAYANASTHIAMLKDQPRMDFYAACLNPDTVRGKVVLDVGCGTGILSMLAARAGAKKVFAVEASEYSFLAEELIAHNGLSSKITVFHSTIEEVKLPVEQVDIVVSEWMGFFLVHESMLKSVLFARNKWLNPDGGVMIPDTAKIQVAPVTLETWRRENISCFGNVLGFDFAPFGTRVFSELTREPIIETLPKDSLVAEPQTIKTINLYEATDDDVQHFFSVHSFHVRGPSHKFGGFALWFTVAFEAHQLPTGPMDAPTHWKQTSVPLPAADEFEVADDAKIDVEFRIDVDEDNPRQYRISLDLV